jgi:hypothetical protein
MDDENLRNKFDEIVRRASKEVYNTEGDLFSEDSLL